jgi:DMSO/TMAO reductase YedYZ molybdopterin-dependent catalytic subunit
MSSIPLPRRRFLKLGVASLGASLLAGCDRLSESPDFLSFLSSAEELTYQAQRLLGGGHALAREFTAADLSPVFKVNGTHMPEGADYAALLENHFANWRLRVDGLVANPLDLSLEELRTMPQRTQITRARLRRRLECHRQMAGGSAGDLATALEPSSRRPLRRLSLRRYV